MVRRVLALQRMAKGLRRNKKVTVLLAVVLVALALTGGLLWLTWTRVLLGPAVQVVIDRRTTSESEQLALAAAEAANYSLFLQRAPFWDGEDTWVPDLDRYTWINYVNTETLGHLVDRTDYCPQKHPWVSIYLKYTATVLWVRNLSLAVMLDGIEASNNSATWLIHGSSSQFAESHCAIRVNDTFVIGAGNGFLPLVDGEYGDAFLVHMQIDYDEYYSPIAAYSTGVEQFVVLNPACEVLMVLTLDQGHVIS